MPKRRGKSVKRNKSWKVKLPNAVDPAQQRAILDTDKHALTLSPAKIRRTRAPEPGTTLNFVPGPLNLMPRFQNNDHNATDSENADLYSRNVIPTEHYDIDASVFQTSKRLQDVVGRYKQAQLETEAYEDALVLSSMRGSGQQATVQRGCDDARKEHEVTPEPVEDTEACALKEEARLAGFSTVSIYQKYLKLRDDLRRMTGPTVSVSLSSSSQMKRVILSPCDDLPTRIETEQARSCL